MPFDGNLEQLAKSDIATAEPVPDVATHAKWTRRERAATVAALGGLVAIVAIAIGAASQRGGAPAQPPRPATVKAAVSSNPVAYSEETDTYYDANGGIVEQDYAHHQIYHNDTFITGSYLTISANSDITGDRPMIGDDITDISNVVQIRHFEGRDFPIGTLLVVDHNGRGYLSYGNGYHVGPLIVYHGVSQRYYNAAGMLLSSTVNVHLYNAEYCHPGYIDRQQPPTPATPERAPNT